jgi:hypothetical protein
VLGLLIHELMTIQAADQGHYVRVANRLLAGKVIPFLGAGANLCGRPPDAGFEQGTYLPSGPELARILVENSGYPVPDEVDLLRVAQYAHATVGQAALYEWLRATFNDDYPPTALHTFLADVAGRLEAAGKPAMAILSTNYDDALERAFEAAGMSYDLVWYEAKRPAESSYFVHATDEGPVPIRRPNEYRALAESERTTIVKLHGAMNRDEPKYDSYVITEDNYVDYLTRADIAKQIPITLRARMTESHFLFLGYSLRDWNLRVVLRRIWGQQPLDLKSWSIQLAQRDVRQTEIDQLLWRARGDIDLLCVPLDEYVELMCAQLDVGR